jgi:hypothetical protein
LKELSDDSLSASFYQSKLMSASSIGSTSSLKHSIIVNALILVSSLFFTVLFLVFNSFRLGIYSHDHFQLGKYIDKSILKLKTTYKTNKDTVVISTISSNNDIEMCNNKNSSVSPASATSSTMSSSTMTGSEETVPPSTSSRDHLTKQKKVVRKWQITNCCSFIRRKPKCWRKLPPIGACFHVISAFLLLIADLHLSSTRIEHLQKPIGDIFATQIDFIFGEPLHRLQKESNPNENAKNDGKSSNEFINIILNELFQSKDDFSLFNSASSKNNFLINKRLTESNNKNKNKTTSAVIKSSLSSIPSSIFMFSTLNTSTTISLLFVNFFIASLVVGSKFGQIFWTTSGRFSALILLYATALSVFLVISYCSFEILFKCRNLATINLNVRLLSISKYDLLILTLLWCVSSAFLMTSISIFVAIGIKNFDKIRRHFEENMNKYFMITTNNSKKIIEETTNVNQINNKQKNENKNITELMDKLTSTSNNNNSCPSLFCFKNKESNPCNNNNHYKAQFKQSFLFLLYCVLRSFLIYQLIAVYKLTHDYFLAVSIGSEFIVIILWSVMLLLFTVKRQWSFSLNAAYKLNYWNWLFKNFSSNNSQQLIVDRHKKNKTTDTITNENEKKNTLKTNQTVKFESLIKCTNDDDELNTNKNGDGLLVRDDSITNVRPSPQLYNNNNNSNISSTNSASSITNVSSLMPSTFVNSSISMNCNEKKKKKKKTNTITFSCESIKPTSTSDDNLKARLQERLKITLPQINNDQFSAKIVLTEKQQTSLDYYNNNTTISCGNQMKPDMVLIEGDEDEDKKVEEDNSSSSRSSSSPSYSNNDDNNKSSNYYGHYVVNNLDRNNNNNKMNDTNQNSNNKSCFINNIELDVNNLSNSNSYRSFMLKNSNDNKTIENVASNEQGETFTHNYYSNLVSNDDDEEEDGDNNIIEKDHLGQLPEMNLEQRRIYNNSNSRLANIYKRQSATMLTLKKNFNDPTTTMSRTTATPESSTTSASTISTSSMATILANDSSQSAFDSGRDSLLDYRDAPLLNIKNSQIQHQNQEKQNNNDNKHTKPFYLDTTAKNNLLKKQNKTINEGTVC